MKPTSSLIQNVDSCGATVSLVPSRTGRYGQLGDDALVATRACGILAASLFTIICGSLPSPEIPRRPWELRAAVTKPPSTNCSASLNLVNHSATLSPSHLRLASSPPPPSPKCSIHSHTLRPSSGSQEIPPADWIGLNLFSSCSRAAAQRSAPVSCRRSTTPLNQVLRDSTPSTTTVLNRSPNISVHLAILCANALPLGMTLFSAATASR